MNFGWKFKNFEGVKSELSGIARGTPEMLRYLLENIAPVVAQDIQQRAPRSKKMNINEHYADEWKVEKITISEERGVAIISNPNDLLYVILEITGRSSGRIDGNPYLAWEDPETGETIIVRFVIHPGFQPTPHVRPALQNYTQKAGAIVGTLVSKKLKIVRYNGKPTELQFLAPKKAKLPI